MNASDVLVECLIDWGVEVIFGLPGDGINGVMEALRTHQDKIQFIQVRHEEAAAFMACGYAKYTGKLGVCLATSGPGGIHLLNGLYDAKMDGQPVLAITGLQFHDLIGTHTQQDVALDKLFMDVCVYNERVMGADARAQRRRPGLPHRPLLPRRGAYHHSRRLPGRRRSSGWRPLQAQYQRPHQCGSHRTATSFRTRDELQRAADILNAGQESRDPRRPRRTGRQRRTRASWPRRLARPSSRRCSAKPCVPDDSPYTTGGIGLLGTAPSQEAHGTVRHPA